MAIEVFKTNVTQRLQCHALTEALACRFPHNSIHFDLGDCDRVLRIDAPEIDPLLITQLLQQRGFNCEVLE